MSHGAFRKWSSQIWKVGKRYIQQKSPSLLTEEGFEPDYPDSV
jgi:hypothetical protein